LARRAEVHGRSGEVALGDADLDSAAAYAVGHDELEARVLVERAALDVARGAPAQQMRHLEEAERFGVVGLRGRILERKAFNALHLGSVEQGEAWIAEAVAAFRSEQDVAGEAMALGTLARILVRIDHQADALSALDDGVRL